MATVSLSPALQQTKIMSNRRLPLSNNPNAANSPFRPTTNAATKRPRHLIDAKEEFALEVQPSAKRQALDNDRSTQRTPSRNPLQNPEARVFNKRPTKAQPTAFERKLLAAKEQSQGKTEKPERNAQETIDGIRQWQNHYRKAFLNFVFYFESVPNDLRAKCARFIRAFGAREERFFSKDVTHVVTTRTIPAENDTSPTEAPIPPQTTSSSQAVNKTGAVNSSLLDRLLEPNTTGQTAQTRSRFDFEASLGRRTVGNDVRDVEPKRQNPANNDVLFKAKEMGMKVWQVEKLHRVLNSMVNVPSETRPQPNIRGKNNDSAALGRASKGADLSTLLKKEQLNGPLDRDFTVSTGEVIPFRGPYIYIRDMDERFKPILVREYPKTSDKTAGEWPQFRCVSAGKCPFVEEVHRGGDDNERPRTRERAANAREEMEKHVKHRTRGSTAAQKSRAPPVIARPPLAEAKNAANVQTLLPNKSTSQGFCAPPIPVAKKSKSPMKIPRTVSGPLNTRMFGGEPAASGLQPSNVTSAIRSQMISSTAAAPGAKAGTSKEVYGLKRKVLERNTGPAPTGLSGPQKHPELLDPSRGSQAPVTRQTRKQTQEMERLVHIDEESTQSEEEDVWRTEEVRNPRRGRSKCVEKQEPRPGYCENCRDKYDDFDEHILGRKHRKFAVTAENFKELDELLSHLGRRLKDDDDCDGF